MVAEAAVTGWGMKGAGCLAQSPSFLPAVLLQPPPCPGLWSRGSSGYRVTWSGLEGGWGWDGGLGRPWAFPWLRSHLSPTPAGPQGQRCSSVQKNVQLGRAGKKCFHPLLALFFKMGRWRPLVSMGGSSVWRSQAIHMGPTC